MKENARQQGTRSGHSANGMASQSVGQSDDTTGGAVMASPVLLAPAVADYFTLRALGSLVKRDPQTIRFHIHQGWLKAEKIEGARGWRVAKREGSRWAAKYLGIKIA